MFKRLSNFPVFFVFLIAGAHAYRPDLVPVKLGTTCQTPYNISADGKYDSTGVYTLNGRGHDLYYGWDRGAFACLPVTADTCTFTARIKTAPSGLSNGKYGICIREGLAGNERAIQIRYDSYGPNQCWTWFFRRFPGSTTSEWCEDGSRNGCNIEGLQQDIKQMDDIHLKIRKEGRFYKIALSTNGTDWRELGTKDSYARIGEADFEPLAQEQKFYLMSDTVYVGLILAGGNQGRKLVSMEVDRINIDFPTLPIVPPNQDPWPSPIADWEAVAPNEHPRLFFRKSDIVELRQRAETPTGEAILAELRRQLGGGDEMPSQYNGESAGSNKSDVSSPIGTYTLWHGAGFGFLYQITGDEKYAQLGKQCVQKALDGQVDRDRRYCFTSPGGPLRAGPSLAAVAMAYDLCFDGWDAEFRRKVAAEIYNYSNPATSLRQMALSPSHSPGSNHYGMIVGGAGLSILSILGDDGVSSDTLQSWLESVRKNAISAVSEGFGDHGWFAEGQPPGNMPINIALVAYFLSEKSAGGLDFITPRPNVPWLTMRWVMELIPRDGAPKYPVWNRMGYGREDLLFLGSSWYGHLTHGGWFSQGFGAIPDEYKPALLWTYENFVDEADEIPYNVGYYPHRSIMAFLHWPADMEPVNPSQVIPQVLQDRKKGYYVFRNGWKDENDILVTTLLGTDPYKAYFEVKAEMVKVWGLGIKTEFPGIFNQFITTHYDPREDGSGVISGVSIHQCGVHLDGTDITYIPNADADVTSLAVDYGKSSGAEALIVMVGETAGIGAKSNGDTKPASYGTVTGPDGATAVSKKVTAGDVTYHVMTLQYGDAPRIEVVGEGLSIGNQTVSYDGDKIVLGSLAPSSAGWKTTSHPRNRPSLQVATASNRIRITCTQVTEGTGVLQMYDLMGRVVFRTVLDGKGVHRVDRQVSDPGKLSGGCYLLRYTKGTTSLSHKLHLVSR